MILWTKTTEALPRIDTDDAWNREHEVSIRVIAAFISTSTGTKSVTFATYFHKTGNWNLDGYTGKFKVIAWSAADFPTDCE